MTDYIGTDYTGGGLPGLLGKHQTMAYAGCGCSMCQGSSSNADDPAAGGGTVSAIRIMAAGRSELLPLIGDGPYGFSGDRNVDATLIGSRWTLKELTYSFPRSADEYGPDYEARGLSNTQIPYNEIQQAAAREGFRQISSFTNMTFREVDGSQGGEQPVLRLSQSLGVSSALGFFPSEADYAGDIFFGRNNQPFYDSPHPGNWGFSTQLHEIGHTMGLKHGHQDYTDVDLSGDLNAPAPRYGSQALTADRDGQAYSLMTYRSNPGADLSFSGDGENQAQTYMQYDVAALQFLYGANYEFRSTGNVYTWSSVTGEMSVDGVGQGLATSNTIFETVWDGGGVDTFDLSNYTTNMTLDLRPGAFSLFSEDQLANNRAYQGEVALAPGNVANALLFQGDVRSLIENATGGSGDDRIIGNQVANVLIGNAGDDSLDGEAGSDVLDGGAGNDTALFTGADGVTVTLNNGTADILVRVGADTDTLRGIENVTGGSGDDTLTGDDGNNVLDGGERGNDVLDGGAGNDRLIGSRFTLSSVDKPDIDKPRTTANTDMASALGLAGAFDIQAKDTVADSTTIPHATVNAVAAGGGYEYYRVDVVAGERAVFDIDTPTGKLDTVLQLLDAAGNLLAENDTGFSGDAGGSGNDDAQISYTFATAGTYYVRVGAWVSDAPLVAGPLNAGETYTLNVSLTNQAVDYIEIGGATLRGGLGDDYLQGTAAADVIDGGAGVDTASFVAAVGGVTVSLAAQGAAQATGGAGVDLVTGIENLIGSRFGDRLTGDAGANVIDGGDGADVLDGGAGVDTLSYASAMRGVTINLSRTDAQETGSGADAIVNFENLTGSAFDDRLSGDTSVNMILGGAGDDVLDGNATGGAQEGLDLLDGGDGTDIASFGGYAGSVVALLNGGFTGTGYVAGVAAAQYRNVEGLAGGSSNDRLIGDGRANILLGNAGDDDLSGGGGDDRLDGGLGDDLLFGGAGSDTAVFSGDNGVRVDLRLVGAQDTGQGRDTLIGIENLTGGSGDDQLIGDDADNVFTDTGGADTYIGNGGSDTVDYSRRTGAVTASLAAPVPQDTGAGGSDTLIAIENLIGTAFNDTLTGDVNANYLFGGAGVNFLVGGGGDDRLVGGDQADLLYGDLGDVASEADGADVLIGGAGRDVLIGGGGNDTLDGGEGDDFLVQGGGFGSRGTRSVSLDGESVIPGGDDVIDGGAGQDFAFFNYQDRTAGVAIDIRNPAAVSAITVGGVAAGSITGVEQISFYGGSGDDIVYAGDASLDILVGNDGDDTLNGGAGDDQIDGGAGNDRIDGGLGLDYLLYLSATGGITLDLREEGPQDTGGSGVDTVTGVENLYGSGFSDRLTGSDELNTIVDIFGGDDQIFGMGGNDTLQVTRAAGPTSNVLIDGGSGADLILFSDLAAFRDSVTIFGGAGRDTVLAEAALITADLGTNDDQVRVNLQGGTYRLTLGAGQDVVTLFANERIGAVEARTSVVTDFQAGDEGDRFDFRSLLLGSLVDYAAGGDPFAGGFLRLIQVGADILLQIDRDGAEGSVNQAVTVFTLLGAASGGLTAFNFDGFTPIITGTDAADTILGSAAGDILEGAGGADTLTGFAGDDLLTGGGGDDRIDGGEGIDTASYAGAGAGVVVDLARQGRAQVTGEGADVLISIENLRGSNFADRLSGDARNNVLTGGLGADLLDGRQGLDVASYADSTSGVTVNLRTGQGFGGAAEGDRLVRIEGVTGSAFDDSLFGDVGADLLDGGDGDDLLSGEVGADRLLGGAGDDRILGGIGADYLQGDAGLDELRGGLGADTLIGGDDADLLFGDAGADILIGGAGDDVLAGGAGRDIFVFEGGFGQDRISDFDPRQDVLEWARVDAGGRSLSATAEGALIAFKDGSSILLEGVDVGELTGQSWFRADMPAAHDYLII